jgi:CBS domain-containing protein
MLENQERGEPVHTWLHAPIKSEEVTTRESFRTVGQIMKTDLFTVGPEDVVDLAATLMDWKHIRHVPVEDSEGQLVGLVSFRQLLRLLGHGLAGKNQTIAVREIMKPSPLTVNPDTSTRKAMEIMREHHIGCLPVVREGKLVGIVTERDFIEMAGKLLDRWLGSEEK